MAKTYKVTLAGKEYDLRYTLGSKGTVREVERAVRLLLGETRISFLEAVLLSSADVQAAVLWGGLKGGGSPGTRSLTVDSTMDLLAEHIDAGGEIGPVMRQARRAVFASGVVGQHTEAEITKLVPDPEPKENEEEEGAASVVPQ